MSSALVPLLSDVRQLLSSFAKEMTDGFGHLTGGPDLKLNTVELFAHLAANFARIWSLVTSVA